MKPHVFKEQLDSNAPEYCHKKGAYGLMCCRFASDPIHTVETYDPRGPRPPCDWTCDGDGGCARRCMPLEPIHTVPVEEPATQVPDEMSGPAHGLAQALYEQFAGKSFSGEPEARTAYPNDDAEHARLRAYIAKLQAENETLKNKLDEWQRYDDEDVKVLREQLQQLALSAETLRRERDEARAAIKEAIAIEDATHRLPALQMLDEIPRTSNRILNVLRGAAKAMGADVVGPEEKVPLCCDAYRHGDGHCTRTDKHCCHDKDDDL